MKNEWAAVSKVGQDVLDKSSRIRTASVGVGRGAGVWSPVWLLVRRAGGEAHGLWGLDQLDQEEPLGTLGFFGCKPTLSNFSQEGHYRKEMVAETLVS